MQHLKSAAEHLQQLQKSLQENPRVVLEDHVSWGGDAEVSVEVCLDEILASGTQLDLEWCEDPVVFGAEAPYRLNAGLVLPSGDRWQMPTYGEEAEGVMRVAHISLDRLDSNGEWQVVDGWFEGDLWVKACTSEDLWRLATQLVPGICAILRHQALSLAYLRCSIQEVLANPGCDLGGVRGWIIPVN